MTCDRESIIHRVIAYTISKVITIIIPESMLPFPALFINYRNNVLISVFVAAVGYCFFYFFFENPSGLHYGSF